MFMLVKTRQQLIRKTIKNLKEKRANQIEMGTFCTTRTTMHSSSISGSDLGFTAPIDLDFAKSNSITSPSTPTCINPNDDELIVNEVISRPAPNNIAIVATAEAQSLQSPQSPPSPKLGQKDQKTQCDDPEPRQAVQQHLSHKSTKNQKHLFDSNQSKITNVIAIIVVMIFSLIFISFGCIFTFFMFAHFENSSQICSNPSELLLLNHPELKIWDQCSFQISPFTTTTSRYDDEYPCNCRHAKINLTSFAKNDDRNVSATIESMLKSWDMLEIVVIIDDDVNTRFRINLTNTDDYNLKYLKIFHLDEIELHNFGGAMENWQNLEYLSISHTHIKTWPNGFNQLNNLRYLKLWDVLYLDELPPNLCQMYNLRALNIFQATTSANKIKTLPECIVNLNELQSIVFYFVLINKFPIDLFTMPNIQEIAFLVSNISLRSFENVDHDISIANMEWNPTSQTGYYFAGSPLCLPRSSNYSAFPDILIEFMDDVNACDHGCEYNDLISNFQCTPLDWQNGICDNQCNNVNCYYDGGDCNQMCDAYYPNCTMSDMFGNGLCDPECNNTLCSYDVGECLVDQYSSINMSQVFGKNATYCDDINNDINNTNLCEIIWINDGWCDDNCRHSQSCFYDANDCDCSNIDNYCQQGFEFFQPFVDTITDQGDNYVSLAGFCVIWNSLSDFIDPNFAEEYIEPYNCTTSFDMIDKDDNQYIDLYEFIYILNTFELIAGAELTETKYQQIDCSTCYEY